MPMKLSLNYQTEMYFHSLILLTFDLIVKTSLLEEVDEQILIYLDQGKDLKCFFFNISFLAFLAQGALTLWDTL